MKVIGENEVKIQLKSSTGPMGPAGPQGPKGEKGERGETGPRGLTGATGLKGDKGDKGDRGEKGATGAQGPQGEKGEKGETGATGAQGPQGEKGETGATGPQGPQGIQGETGPQGEQGPKGEKGEKGDKGDTGPQGPAGSIDNLPIAGPAQLGGVMPVAKTDEMTQEVGVDAVGKLWGMPGGSSVGSSGATVDLLIDHTFTGEEMYVLQTLDTPRKYIRYFLVFEGSHSGTAGFFELKANAGTGQWKGQTLGRTLDSSVNRMSPWVARFTEIPGQGTMEIICQSYGTNTHNIHVYRQANSFDPYTTYVNDVRFQGQNMSTIIADAGARVRVWGERYGG